MRNTIAILVLTLIFVSCGTKTKKSTDTIINTTKIYVSKIDNNKTLKEEFTEGALTDEKGFEDIGTFKYSVLFDKDSKELFRIKNVEISKNTVTEYYYFQNHKLVYIVSSTPNQNDKKIYTNGDKKVVSSSNASDDEVKLLLQKAKRFKKSFYRQE
ncbi:hypothetical protein [Psychroserpens damuponensis]|uniref:hypothetical protein n=1 Tax=Psychroserpens damuponensis TaxID=943936 RepID=UPI00058CB951|nr:hypothetical protein [Psychroserpens damuponensis]